MSPVFKVYAEINLPRLPRRLLFAGGAQRISIADVTDESLRQLGAEWTEALVALANEMRAKPRDDEEVDL